MVFSEALTLGGSLLSGLFGGDDTEPQKQGFAALPKRVQDAFLDTYLPAALEDFERQYEPLLPFARAQDPRQDPFASQGLFEIQQMADRSGGLFGAPPQQQATPPAAVDAETIGAVLGTALSNSPFKSMFNSSAATKAAQMDPTGESFDDLMAFRRALGVG